MEIGIDIVSVERIKKALEKEGFKEHIFTEKEINYCEKYKKKEERYAGKFAAKEAVVKAMGTGFTGISHKDIEILNDINGKPYVSGYDNIKISISHEETYAVANALLLEKDNEN